MNRQNRAACEAVVRKLWPHLDGVLPDTDRERVARHLEACVDCRSHFDFARAFLEAVTAAHTPAAADHDGLRDRVLAALAAEGYRG